MSTWNTDEPFGIVPKWVATMPISDRAVRLYTILGCLRDYSTDMAQFGRKYLAQQMNCSLDKLDRAKRELEEHGLISIEHRQNGSGTARNIYTLHRAKPQNSGPPRSRSSAAPNENRTRSIVSANADTQSEAPLRTQVKQAWLEAPGMIQHRPAYFLDSTIRGKIDRAVRKYGVADVVTAIQNYAQVYESSAHFFKYRWTLGDFLQRGLDRFVPEAEPLRVFLLPELRESGGLTKEEASARRIREKMAARGET